MQHLQLQRCKDVSHESLITCSRDFRQCQSVPDMQGHTLSSSQTAAIVVYTTCNRNFLGRVMKRPDNRMTFPQGTENNHPLKSEGEFIQLFIQVNFHLLLFFSYEKHTTIVKCHCRSCQVETAKEIFFSILYQQLSL